MRLSCRYGLVAAGFVSVLVLASGSARGGSHTWDVNEIFSNADGTIQFIELWEANGSPGETGVPGHTMSSNLKSFVLPGSPLAPPTSNKFYLIATQAFADLPGAPAPDAIIPAGLLPFFFSVNGDTIAYEPWDSFTFGAGVLPTDGVTSLNKNLTTGVNSPTNYAGATGSIDVSLEVRNEFAKLLALDGAASDRFGNYVSLSDDVLFVGAPQDDDNGSNSGSAYAYRRTGAIWMQEQKLVPPDGAATDFYGVSASVEGDVAAVGSLLHGDNGAVYVYRWDGSSWMQEQKLVASDAAAADDHFGFAVSLSGDVITVGARFDDDSGGDSGSAYVFRYDASQTVCGQLWCEEQKLLASDGAAGDRFGTSVSAWNDVILVGSLFDVHNGVDTGSAYAFRWDGSSWVEEQKLVAGDGASGDLFGAVLSVSGDAAVIGAQWDDDKGADAGSAYVFRRNGTSWVEEQKLLASDGAAGDEFGTSVSLDGGVAVVGARLDNVDPLIDTGSAYVFRWDGSTWKLTQKLLATDGIQSGDFGRSVAVVGDRAAVGAPNDDDNGALSGSAYVFDLCTDDAACDDADVCTCDECTSSGCVFAPVALYGDVFPQPCGNGAIDVDDILCTLAGFANFAACPGADIFPQCSGNGVIDVDDILASLAAFGGATAPACGC